LGSSGSQNASKTRQNRRPEPEKKTPPSEADKFFELFEKLPRKTSELPRDNGLCKKSESIKRCWVCKERILRLSA
jgi:hypothetical protein